MSDFPHGIYTMGDTCDKQICTQQHVRDTGGNRRHWHIVEAYAEGFLIDGQAIADAWGSLDALVRARSRYDVPAVADLLDALAKKADDDS